MMVLLDTEFTGFIGPELLSLGMATVDDPTETFYAEVDMASDDGKRLAAQSSDFVREAVLTQWRRIPDTAGTPWEVGRRAGEWLTMLHERSKRDATCAGGRVSIGFDYSDDYELLEYAIRDAGLWDRVREVVRPVHVDAITGTIEGEIAAEECYETLRAGGLRRHHALADALALRAAYRAVRKRLIDG